MRFRLHSFRSSWLYAVLLVVVLIILWAANDFPDLSYLIGKLIFGIVIISILFWVGYYGNDETQRKKDSQSKKS